MLGYIRTQALGNVTRDIEIKKTTSGKSVASFTLAVNSRVEGETDYIDIVAWEEKAEFAEKFLMKGKPIEIHGKLKQRSFEVDGQKRSKLELHVNEYFFVGGDRKEENRPLKQHEVIAMTRDVAPVDVSDEPISLESIPF